MDSFTVVTFPSKAANLSNSNATEDGFQFRR